ncbi:D-alanyl-D-alanine carboxypeptidase family protein [Bacillus shivajii]|uniref:D-alanyl-D-alanine carboxypeptidase family protein n=1 Tax=Bacillus shivajii TaxID=1983719 RepID=UPI001CFC0AE6|nr:D-alanyl-D-alanine carboxypeptidase family protein [Bacillus shivajii]UCZ54076.1 D-alanyl-D-alanine carboxypeptidase family protein [Bacillus shivajii]
MRRLYLIMATLFLFLVVAIIGYSTNFSSVSILTDSNIEEEKQNNGQEEDSGYDSSKEEETQDQNEIEDTRDIEERSESEEQSEKEQTDKIQDEHPSLPDGSFTIGSQGEGVSDLQGALRQIGYDVPDDGVYQTETAKAIYHFQQAHDELGNDGLYGPNTRSMLEERLASGEKMETENFLKLELPNQDPGNQFPPRGELVKDPDDILVLVNKENHLPAGYTPFDLMEPDVPFPFDEDLPQKLMRAEAAEALELLFEATEKEGLHLFAQSGYRSYNRQREIFTWNANERGEEQANQYSARAGESEHQTGLAMDVTTHEVNFRLTTDFADTAEGQWIAENAANYGFIIRYPKGKEHITGYQYEPWHLRYVGKEVAKEIMENNLTLEEYLEDH